jgi:hypothetical protein
MFIRCLSVAFALALIALAGCSKHTKQDDSMQLSLGREDADYIVVIAIDLSGSFADRMTYDGKGYAFTMRVADNYFRNSIGTKNRIIIAQLSAPNRQPLLWDGTPIELRQDFPSATEFRNFLLSKSHPAGSRIHDGVADALDYVLSDPGVAKGKTRSALFVLSDFEDNAPNLEQSEKRLAKGLSDFAKKNGVVGFYFLEHSRVPLWRQHLQQSGIKNWVCESEIVAYPPLPVFE